MPSMPVTRILHHSGFFIKHLTKRALPSLLVNLAFLLWVGAVAQAEEVQVTLLQLNDVYQMTPTKLMGSTRETGGLARVATLKKAVEKENPNTVFILAGDTLSPSLASSVFKGKQMIALWNQLGLTLAGLGNHEFDFGPNVLKQRIQDSTFPWVASNIQSAPEEESNQLGTIPYKILSLGSIKIGFLGLLTPETESSSYTGKKIAITDPVVAAQKAMAIMQKHHVDAVIAITHLYLDDDKKLVQALSAFQTPTADHLDNNAKNKKPLLKLVAGGHEHIVLQSVVDGIPILKVGSDAAFLGRYDLNFDADTHQLTSLDIQLMPVDETIEPDPEIQASINQYTTALNASLNQTVGQTTAPLNARQQDNRSQETNLGNWIADSFQKKYQTDFAIVNGGSIRSNTVYPVGSITQRQLNAVQPFGNTGVILKVSGITLKTLFEHSVSLIETKAAGRFLQVSRQVDVVVDPKKPVGKRIVKLLVNKKQVKPTDSFSVAMTDFLAGGGDGYAMLKHCPRLNTKRNSSTHSPSKEIDILIEALKREKTIHPAVDGRIQFL
ncbi:MAG: bifunctional UDP-sugar hydrolase/5'-nucleotidase [Cyanobacteria bacterium P01_H01_bin.74]